MRRNCNRIQGLLHDTHGCGPKPTCLLIDPLGNPELPRIGTIGLVHHLTTKEHVARELFGVAVDLHRGFGDRQVHHVQVT